MRENADDLGSEPIFSGTEAHTSFGKGERYHHPLRRIFNIFQQDHPELDNNSKVRISTNPIRSTMGLKSLVCSLLVFRTIPPFPPTSRAQPSQVQRFKALKLAHPKMGTIEAANSINKALKSKLPPSIHYLIKPEDNVGVYRLKNQALGRTVRSHQSCT